MIASVAICTWNRAALLDQTLARFQQLTPPVGTAWELLVVNNNCTDDTDSVVKKYVGRLPIRLIHERTPGKVHALNRSIAEANGEYILFTDDDALVEPNWMTEVLSKFQSSSADMVFGRVLPWWETQPPKWYGDILAANFALLDYGSEPFIATTMQRQPFGVNYSFRKSVFQEIGLYKTDLGPRGGKGFGGEDDEIFRRMLMNHKVVAYHPAAVVHHYVPKIRCEKSYHRMRSWLGSTDHLNLLRDEANISPHLPRLFGVPRYFFRMNLSYFGQYLKSVLKRDRAAAFFYEMKLIRLVGLLKAIMKQPNPSPCQVQFKRATA